MGTVDQKAGDLIYTGVGARKTPPAILAIMSEIGTYLAGEGFKLRSGAAAGADTAFELGHKKISNNAEIYLPWKGFRKNIPDCSSDIVLTPELEDKCLDILVEAKVEVNIRYYKQGVRKLFARNVLQLLGTGLDLPSSMCICWAPGPDLYTGKVNGGTRIAVDLARYYEVDVYNLKLAKDRAKLIEEIGLELDNVVEL